MATLQELLDREAALERAIATGALRVEHGERSITYQRFADLRSALAEVRRELRGTPVTEIKFSTSKGLSR